MSKIKGYMTREELSENANRLSNPIDQFILFAIYNGIAGRKNMEDLLTLKTKDIDLKNKVIYIGDKKISMDDEFLRIAKKAMNQKTYYVNSESKFSSIEYELNSSSEYVLKTKQTADNNFGLNGYKYTGFRRKYRNIQKEAGLDILASELETSGLINSLLEIKTIWTSREIDYYCMQNDLKFNTFRVYKILKQVVAAYY